MAEATQVIEMIKRIIADDTADLRERIQHLESRTVGLTPIGGAVESPPPQAEQVREVVRSNDELQQRLDAIKAIHRLDATPVQWVRGSDGKQVEAPEGLWEISCTACNYTTNFKDGQPQPKPCKTVRLANGETVT